jgi:hypothetical protein
LIRALPKDGNRNQLAVAHEQFGVNPYAALDVDPSLAAAWGLLNKPSAAQTWLLSALHRAEYGNSVVEGPLSSTAGWEVLQTALLEVTRDQQLGLEVGVQQQQQQQQEVTTQQQQQEVISEQRQQEVLSQQQQQQQEQEQEQSQQEEGPLLHTLILTPDAAAAAAVCSHLQQLPAGRAVTSLPPSADGPVGHVAVADVDTFTTWLQALVDFGARSELPASQVALWGLKWVLLWDWAPAPLATPGFEPEGNAEAAAPEGEPAAQAAAKAADAAEKAASPEAKAAAPSAEAAEAVSKAAAADAWPPSTSQVLKVLHSGIAAEGLTAELPSYLLLSNVSE